MIIQIIWDTGYKCYLRHNRTTTPDIAKASILMNAEWLANQWQEKLTALATVWAI